MTPTLLPTQNLNATENDELSDEEPAPSIEEVVQELTRAADDDDNADEDPSLDTNPPDVRPLEGLKACNA